LGGFCRCITHDNHLNARLVAAMIASPDPIVERRRTTRIVTDSTTRGRPETEGGGEGKEKGGGGKEIESQVDRVEFVLFLFLTRSRFRIGMPRSVFLIRRSGIDFINIKSNHRPRQSVRLQSASRSGRRLSFFDAHIAFWGSPLRQKNRDRTYYIISVNNLRGDRAKDEEIKVDPVRSRIPDNR